MSADVAEEPQRQSATARLEVLSAKYSPDLFFPKKCIRLSGHHSRLNGRRDPIQVGHSTYLARVLPEIGVQTKADISGWLELNPFKIPPCP